MANAGHIIMNGKLRTSSSRRPAPRTGREYLEQQLADKPESAAMDRHKLLTEEQKARGAINTMTRDAMNSERAAGNSAPNEEQIRSEMVKVANRVEKKKDK